MAKAKTSTEVLRAAKWMLENVGWVQGSGRKYKGNKVVALCASQAINEVVVENDQYMALNEAHQRLSAAMGRDVINFNDDKNTTKKMVLRAFDKAIKGSK